MTNRRLFTAAGSMLALSLALASQMALAQAPYPSKPIRWVIPSPAGSPVDSIGRKLGQSVAKRLGEPVVVDNKPGAVGTIGAAEVARAAPDGYTFMFCVGDPLIGALAVLKSLPYDPRSDFSFISKVAANGPMLMANPSVKANNLPELIAQLKASGEPLSYGSWGPGTLPTQVMETMAKQAGVKLLEVPYRGSPPALQDVLGNQIAMTFVSPLVGAPLIAQGKLKPLAVVSHRSTVLPNVGTFAEAGFTSYVFNNEIWVGLLGPAKMEPAIRDKMAEAVRASLQESDMKDFLTNAGFAVIGNSPAEFEKEYRTEVEIIPKLISDLGVKPQ